MDRRNLLACIAASATGALTPGTSRAASLPAVSVYRNPGCGCCESWALLMSAAGFQVSIEDDPNLDSRRERLGIPAELASCHTAIADGLVIEGHVPPGDILRLLEERLSGAIGLVVPGMPAGSPGMGPQGSGPAYDVLLLRSNAAPTVYASH